MRLTAACISAEVMCYIFVSDFADVLAIAAAQIEESYWRGHRGACVCDESGLDVIVEAAYLNEFIRCLGTGSVCVVVFGDLS